MPADYQSWLNFYQENLGRFLKMPMLGVARESLMQMTAAADAYNRFILNLTEFSVKFGVPFQTALDGFRQAAESRATAGTDSGNGPAEAEFQYDLLVRLLDKAYDDYLKSPEGVRAVADLISQYLAYEQKARAVREIGLKAYGLPTPKEMDQAHKEIYHLKKALQAQNQVLAAQNKAIANMQRRIDALSEKSGHDAAMAPTAASERSGRKKKSKGDSHA